jgi:hypothetical protein
MVGILGSDDAFLSQRRNHRRRWFMAWLLLEHSASRCLKDSEARELQFLWDMAANEKRIMKYVGE